MSSKKRLLGDVIALKKKEREGKKLDDIILKFPELIRYF